MKKYQGATIDKVEYRKRVIEEYGLMFADYWHYMDLLCGKRQ